MKNEKEKTLKIENKNFEGNKNRKMKMRDFIEIKKSKTKILNGYKLKNEK